MKILIVDDNEIILESLKIILEDARYNTYTAYNGVDGLKQFKENKFDLIITDIIMPDMDGIELIKQIKKINNDVKVLVMSGGDLGPQYKDLVLKFGAIKFLHKPFNNNLLQIIKETING